MTTGWQTTTVGESCTVTSGGTPSKSITEYWNGKTPWVSAKDLKYDRIDSAELHISTRAVEESATKIAPVGSLLMLVRGMGLANGVAIGEVVSPVAFNQDLRAILPPASVNSRFLLLALRYHLTSGEGAGVLSSAAHGTLKIDADKVRQIPFPIPPVRQQQRIVSILDEAFEGIATANANAKRNVANARALFEGSLEFVFTQRGDGWVDTTIEQTCTLRSGTTVAASLERPTGGIPYLKVADMNFDGNEDQVTTSSRFLLTKDVKESAIIPAGATIFPKRGGAILTNKKRIVSLPICADLNIMAVIPSSAIDPRLLYLYFLNVDMRKLGTGSSIPQINNYDVAPLRISFPKSLKTQIKIVERMEDLRGQSQRLTSVYESKLEALEALKKSLLHRAFTGQL